MISSSPVGQILGIVIGGFVYAAILKFLLATIFKKNPIFMSMSIVLIVFFIVAYAAGAISVFFMGFPNIVSAVIPLLAFLIQPAIISIFVSTDISTNVNTMASDRITYGQAFVAQLIPLAILVGGIFLLIQLE